MRDRLSTCLGLLLLVACTSTTSQRELNRTAPVRWAIAIHGGAGTISKSMGDAKAAEYRAALDGALREGARILESGGESLDAVAAVVQILEDDPHFNAGRGAVFTNAGTHELDACIMDGRTLACGAVTGVKTVRHPIALAREVMLHTKHILLAGDGAEKFADERGLERVPNTWFDTDARRQAWEQVKAEEARSGGGGSGYGTVGAVARDARGHLACATSTGGLTNKRFGRVGDTPLVGAGSYADDRTCAVSCTGTGEVFMRHGVARDLSAQIEYRHSTVREAAHAIIHDKLQKDDGGLIAVGADGSIAMEFNSEGMYRGAADSTGRFEVHIWEE